MIGLGGFADTRQHTAPDHSAAAETKALKLLRDGRVNFALPADYREGKQIDKVIKTILDKIAKERDLEILQAKEEAKKKKIQLQKTLENAQQKFCSAFN